LYDNGDGIDGDQVGVSGSDDDGESGGDDSESELHSANNDRFVSVKTVIYNHNNTVSGLFGEDFEISDDGGDGASNAGDDQEAVEMAMVEAEETDLANYFTGKLFDPLSHQL